MKIKWLLSLLVTLLLVSSNTLATMGKNDLFGCLGVPTIEKFYSVEEEIYPGDDGITFILEWGVLGSKDSKEYCKERTIKISSELSEYIESRENEEYFYYSPSELDSYVIPGNHPKEVIIYNLNPNTPAGTYNFFVTVACGNEDCYYHAEPGDGEPVEKTYSISKEFYLEVKHPECYQNIDCNDNNPITIDSCQGDINIRPRCINSPCNIICSSNLDCNDGLLSTSDICINGGTCESLCKNETAWVNIFTFIFVGLLFTILIILFFVLIFKKKK